MNRKSSVQQPGGIGDRRGGVGGRVESDNDDMDESGLSDDDDEQVRVFIWFRSSKTCLKRALQSGNTSLQRLG